MPRTITGAPRNCSDKAKQSPILTRFPTSTPRTSPTLADVGLEHLKAELDLEDRWGRRLTDDEKQSLAFARVVLQKPNWVVANDALDILNPTSRMRIRDIMSGALSHIGLIYVGHDVTESGVYHCKIHLVRSGLRVRSRDPDF